MAAKKRQRTQNAGIGRQPQPPGQSGAVDAIQRDLARAALQKRQRGETPTQQELRALRRVEKARREQLAWEIYGAIPKGHWVEMSGRQARTINEQAQRYGIPFGGRTISLPDVVRALHDFLAANKHRLAVSDDEDPILSGPSTPWLEKLREEKAKLARLQRLEYEGKLVSRDRLHEGLGRVMSIIREGIETLQRQFGAEAHALMDDALTDAERGIADLFAYDRNSRSDA